jgi:amidase
MIERRGFLEFAALAGALAPAATAEARTRKAAAAFKPATADASAMAAAVKRGQVSAAALVETALKRLDAVNGRLNAVSQPYPMQARERAATTGPKTAGALAGIPTLIKDNVEQQGAAYTFGSRLLAKQTGEVDSSTVAAMLAAGLVSLGRSNLPEFGLLPTTEPLLFGPTRSPWNPEHSAGGSSGGSAACVAAGVVPVAHANDGGGSIRIPASVNGLIGLKPSRARMAGEEPAKGATALSVNGCVSRSVRDTAAWLAAMESRSGPLKPVGLVTGPVKRAFRIGLRPDSTQGAPDADVLAVFQSTAKQLQRLGHRLVDAPMPFDGPAVEAAFELIWGAGMARRLDALAKRFGRVFGPDDLEPSTFGFAGLAKSATPATLEAAVATLEAMAVASNAQFDAFDILLTPVLGTPPPPIGYLAPTVPFETLRERLRRYVAYTPVENASGACAISLPMGMSATGLPIGMQFVAPPGGERRLLELAYALEAARDWGRLRPAIWAA